MLCGDLLEDGSWVAGGLADAGFCHQKLTQSLQIQPPIARRIVVFCCIVAGRKRRDYVTRNKTQSSSPLQDPLALAQKNGF